MTSAMRKINRHLLMAFAAAVVSVILPCNLSAQKSDTSQSQILDLSDLTLDQTLLQPQVPTKLRSEVKAYMTREAKALQKMGYKVETMRHGEVVIATIPAEKLFSPNDTLLAPYAAESLKPFLSYFNTSGKFKVILAMHSDDTGADSYLYDLTEKRILALYEYFDHNATQTEMLQGYPMADSEPVSGVENNSMQNRRKNRRLEIYLVPGPTLIAELGKKVK